MTTPHYHRCKECNERMDFGCIDPSCNEGVRWVIVCIHCYERLQEAAEETIAW